MDREKQPTRSKPAGVSVPNIFIALAVLIIICAILLYGMTLTKNYQLSSTEKKLTSTQEEIADLGDVDKEAKIAAAAVETFSELNEDKNYWSEFLGEIAAKTIVTVRLTELSMEEEGENINVEGITESYEGLAKFIKSLRSSSRIASVGLVSANFGETGVGGIGFILGVTPSGSAFTPEAQEVVEED